MNFIKSYGTSALGLLILLIVLMVTLNLLRKVPVIGKAAAVAQDLAQDGKVG